MYYEIIKGSGIYNKYNERKLSFVGKLAVVAVVGLIFLLASRYGASIY